MRHLLLIEISADVGVSVKVESNDAGSRAAISRAASRLIALLEKRDRERAHDKAIAGFAANPKTKSIA